MEDIAIFRTATHHASCVDGGGGVSAPFESPCCQSPLSWIDPTLVLEHGWPRGLDVAKRPCSFLLYLEPQSSHVSQMVND